MEEVSRSRAVELAALRPTYSAADVKQWLRPGKSLSTHQTAFSSPGKKQAGNSLCLYLDGRARYGRYTATL